MSTDSAAQDPRPQQHSADAAPVGDGVLPAQPAPTPSAPAPSASAQAAPAPAPAPSAQPDARSKPPVRTGPRTGPIVWGALILAFCGYAAQRAFGPGGMDTAWWITATVIGLGLLLLVVGVAVAVRNRG
ncbi:hypothetical protein [Leucobacter sp.]